MDCMQSQGILGSKRRMVTLDDKKQILQMYGSQASLVLLMEMLAPSGGGKRKKDNSKLLDNSR